ncbi:MAG TPA: hypothetical protein VGP45_09545, partial [Marinobacter sp.]|nr:hypothetical protein [Marinobacter sp.]
PLVFRISELSQGSAKHALGGLFADLGPMYLYWCGRNPKSDFLYQPKLGCYLDDRRLTELNTAFSRSADKTYVQDTIVADEIALRQLLEKGAQVLVCGGRYLEDVY